MELAEQVVLLELAQKLKELGIKQDSLFYWIKAQTSENVCAYGLTFVSNIFNPINNFKEIYSAFTVAELYDILPCSIDIFGLCMEVTSICINNRINNLYKIMYKDNDKGLCVPMVGLKLADCLAKMLIYLIENGQYDRDLVYK